MKHLTEEQIEIYFSAPQPEMVKLIKEHTASCAACREKMEVEKAIRNYFTTAHAPELPDSFATNLLHKIEFGNDSKLPFTEVILISLGVLVTVITFYFTGFTVPNFTGFIGEFFKSLGNTFSLIQNLPLNPVLAAFVVLAILLVQFVDRRFLRMR